ncbi:tail fiber adhesin [Vibrio phage VPMS1]|uniref:tail fiber adhesin n=1 Tax=Vibrio phage VPMS1 TaxID=1233488 RepID=UPI000358438C|nr:tail fiber adhesin [Vibrio phage VPMS1]AFV51097.1 short tail fiber adhesin [Vibrio phage VPMS1]
MSFTYTYQIQGQVVSTNAPLIPFMDNKYDRKAVVRLEEHLKTLPGVDLSGGDVEHFFSDGLYARKLNIPADTVLVGHAHLQGQINFLMKGTIRVTTDEGVKTLTAPQIVVSAAGTKRAGYAITDTTWVTVSATEETDPESVRAAIIATGEDDPRLKEVLCLGVQ